MTTGYDIGLGRDLTEQECHDLNLEHYNYCPRCGLDWDEGGDRPCEEVR